MGTLDDNKWMRRGFLLAVLFCLVVSGGLALTAVLLPEWITFACEDDVMTTASPLASELLRGKIGLWELCLNYDFINNTTRSAVTCSTFGSSDCPMARPEWMTQIVWQAMCGVSGNCLAVLLISSFTLASVPIRRTGALGFAATCTGIAGFYIVAMILSFSAEYHVLDAVEEFACVEPHASKGTSFHLIGWACAALALGCLVSLIAAGLASPTPYRPEYRKVTKAEVDRKKNPDKKYILPGALEFFNQAGYWEDEYDTDMSGSDFRDK